MQTLMSKGLWWRETLCCQGRQLEGEARPQSRFLLVGVAEGAVRAIDVGKAAHDLALFQKPGLRILQAPRRTKILNDLQRPPNDGVCAV